MSNKPLIQHYGEIILSRYPEIIDSRKEFTFPFEIDFTSPETLEQSNPQIIDFIITTFRDVIPDIIPRNNIKIIHKTIPEKGLNWHIDDCQLVSMKEPPTFKVE